MIQPESHSKDLIELFGDLSFRYFEAQLLLEKAINKAVCEVEKEKENAASIPNHS